MGLVRLEAVQKTYPRGKVRALDGLSVELPLGPVGLLGPNGAGKTTLL
ncbi:MAG: putative transporter ATP-binding protein YxlF, partial [Planctomycetota bacterium]